MKKILVVLLALSLTGSAFATGKVVDADSFKSSDHTKTWTPPAATDTLVGRSSTDTFTNKTVDAGSNTITGILNSSIASLAGIVYSKLNLVASIVNADINAAAAIAYSKLALAGSIVNADINSAAAIAYSKLALTGSIVSGDIVSNAAIPYSKLRLTSSIISGDLASNIGIPLSALASQADATVIANTAGSSAPGVATTLATLFDKWFGSSDGTYSLKRLSGVWSLTTASSSSSLCGKAYYPNDNNFAVSSASLADFSTTAGSAMVATNYGIAITEGGSAGNRTPTFVFTPTSGKNYWVKASQSVNGSVSNRVLALSLTDGTTIVDTQHITSQSTSTDYNLPLQGVYQAASGSAVTFKLQGASNSTGALTINNSQSTTRSSIELSICLVN